MRSTGRCDSRAIRAARGLRRDDRRALRHLQHDPSRPRGPCRRAAPALAVLSRRHRPWARGSSRSAPEPAIPTTSGAPIPTTRRPRPGATSSRAWQVAIRIAEAAGVDLGDRARTRQCRVVGRGGATADRRDASSAPEDRLRRRQPVRARTAGRAARHRQPGGRPPRRSHRHGPRQGSRRRRATSSPPGRASSTIAHYLSALAGRGLRWRAGRPRPGGRRGARGRRVPADGPCRRRAAAS